MLVKHVKLADGVEVEGWRIRVQKGAIASSAAKDALTQQLQLGGLPEMVFLENSLRVEHLASGCTLLFDTTDALRGVAHEAPATIHVAAASTWRHSNQAQVAAVVAAASPDQPRVPQYDWTFATAYQGTWSHPASLAQHETEARIPLERLTSPEPILFYDHVHLYEDELSDNGISELSVKVRVMPSYWFALLRLWIRVDDVLFRIIDTRYFADYHADHILRETTTREGSWAQVEKHIRHLKQLGDPNFIGSVLPVTQGPILHRLTWPGLPEASSTPPPPTETRAASAAPHLT